MRCPTCRHKRMIEKGSLSNWWCPNCGTAVNPSGVAVVPAQAKRHAAWRKALETIAADGCENFLTDDDLKGGKGLCQHNGATEPCFPCIAFAALAPDDGKEQPPCPPSA